MIIANRLYAANLNNNMYDTIISHLRHEEDGRWIIQTNDEHQQGVARLAESFADAVGLGSWGRVLGLLHDKGKERTAFQAYIRRSSGYDPTTKPTEEHTHAYVGALLAEKLYPGLSILLANAIASHHSGLHDAGDLEEILKKSLPEEVTIPAKCELAASPFQCQQKDFHHIIRWLFSCLVDADWLDTEAFMDKDRAAGRNNQATITELQPMLMAHLEKLNASAEPTKVNEIRRRVQQRAVEMAGEPQGFYSMTVPTGGGKTLSSLAWAMNHAARHNLDRIIIAIPYTTIIAQTAETLRGIFGAENVLEHHSAMREDDFRENDPRRLATENWDAPIVVTTNVRLFESMYAARPSACRRLHNIARSVLILDEAQSLPREFLNPIVHALDTYRRLFHTTVLFTTASQPVLAGNHRGCNPRVEFKGLENVVELIPREWKLYDSLRRAEIAVDNTPETYDAVARKISAHARVLAVVNTRCDAQELYSRLPDDKSRMHLSRMMCAAHLRAKIEEMKRRLADGSPLRVVATQLIEAGVDIDFPVVYRAEAGLDSVLQAAGRCNREGQQLDKGHTYVFSLKGEHRVPLGSINDGNEARLNLGPDRDWLAPETMTDYFLQLYARTSTFDKEEIERLIYNMRDMNFSTVAERFHLIEDNGIPIVVPYGDSSKLTEELRQHDLTRRLIRQLGDYTVTVHRRDFETLHQAGVIEDVQGINVLTDKRCYKDETGLVIENRWLNEILIK